jgi:hypothetical protein
VDAPPRARGTSLWLAPEGEEARPFSAVIDRLAIRLGTPSFPPHLTLLAGACVDETEAIARGRELSSRLAPLSVDLVALEGRDEPFRCLFLRAAASPALRAAHEASARAFGREPDPGFLPHLSLVYGALAPPAKSALFHELATVVPARFKARSVRLWRTEGPVSAWRPLGAFSLDSA